MQTDLDALVRERIAARSDATPARPASGNLDALVAERLAARGVTMRDSGLSRLAEVSQSVNQTEELNTRLREGEDALRIGTMGDLATEAARATVMLPAQGMDTLAATTRAAAANSRMLRPVLDPIADAAGTAANLSNIGFRNLTGEIDAPGPDLNLGQPSGTLMGAVGSGLPQIGMATALGAATGGLGPAAAYGGFAAGSAAPVVGSTYREALNETGNAAGAANEAMLAGGITGATSMLPARAILSRTPAGQGILGAIERTVAGRVGGAMGAEAAQEYVEGASQDVLAIAMRQGRLPTPEETRDILFEVERAIDLIAGGALGGVARGGIEAGRAVTRNRARPETPAVPPQPEDAPVEGIQGIETQVPVEQEVTEVSPDTPIIPETPTAAVEAAPVLPPPAQAPAVSMATESPQPDPASMSRADLITEANRLGVYEGPKKTEDIRARVMEATAAQASASTPIPAQTATQDAGDAPASDTASGLNPQAQQTLPAQNQYEIVPPQAALEMPVPRESTPAPTTTEVASSSPQSIAQEPPKPSDVIDAAPDGDDAQTSARNAMMDEDRAALGLDALDGPSRRSWGRAIGDAKRSKKVDDALSIAQQVVNKPRALTDTETAAMVIRAADIKKRHAELLQGVQDATDPADIRLAGEEALRIEQDFDLLTDALRRAGTETGRALAARKLTIDKDFKLLPTLARAKAAKGAALSPKERASIERVVGELEAMTKRAEAAEKKLAERRAERAVLRSREAPKRTPQTREADISRLLAKTQELLKAGCR